MTFADGELSKTISVFTINDKEWEGDEYFTVNLTSATNGGTLVSPSVATVTMIDPDPVPAATIQFSQAAYSVRESESNSVVLTATRYGNVSSTVSVNYATTNGTAVAPDDYQAASGTLTFLPGEITKAVNVFIFTDAPVENPDETFTVALSNPVGATLGANGTATVSIRDASATPAVGTAQFSLSPCFTNEGDGGVQVTVTRTGGASGPLNLTYATLDGTATAGSDYTAAAGSISFANRDTFPKTFTIRVSLDTLSEGNESFQVRLLNAGTPIAGTTVYIVDGVMTNQAGFLQFEQGDYSATETPGGINQVVNVVRIGGSQGTVSVNYATTDDTALTNFDYLTRSGTLTFGPGVTVQPINIPILDNSAYEDRERFFVTLSNPTGGAQLGGTQATVTITDDEPEPPGEFSLVYNGTAIPVAEGQPAAKVRVQRLNGQAGAVTVSYNTANISAVSGADYTGTTSGTLNFANGEASKDILIPILDDTTPEGPETFFVNLTGVSAGVIVAPSQAVVQINDNDSVVPVISSLSQNRAVTGQVVSLTVNGSNFGNNPSVIVSGGEVIITRGSFTDFQIQATLDIPATATLGERSVTVVTSSGATSASVPFTIYERPQTTQLSFSIVDPEEEKVTVSKRRVGPRQGTPTVTLFAGQAYVGIFHYACFRVCPESTIYPKVTGLPPNATATPEPPEVTINQNFEYELKTATSTPAGSYGVTVYGEFSDVLFGSTVGYSFTLVVMAPPTVTLNKCPQDFLPLGGSQDNQVQITATAVSPPNTQGKFRFTLYEVSDEKGYCLNGPLTAPSSGEDSDTWKDLQFPSQTGFVISGSNNEIAETSSNQLSTATVTVKSFDYGAFGKIKVEFIVGNKKYPGVEEGSQQQFTTIPLDADGNHIADSAPQNSGPGTNNGPADDKEPGTQDGGFGQGRGDRLTRYQEYRGFLVNGSHTRTDVTKKDVFYFDRDNIGHQNDWTEQNLGVPIHKFRLGEIALDKSIMPNTESHTGLIQKAIVQQNDLGAGNRTNFWGETHLGVPAFSTFCFVHTDSEAGGIRSGTNLKTELSITETTVVLEKKSFHPGWVSRGLIKIGDEIMLYEGVMEDATTVTLMEVRRGMNGTNAQGHTAGAFVPYFVDPDDIITFVTAHEAGHACSMDEDVTNRSQMTQLKAGEFRGGGGSIVHQFRKTGESQGSTQQFTVN